MDKQSQEKYSVIEAEAALLRKQVKYLQVKIVLKNFL
jgi:hypothetical protein